MVLTMSNYVVIAYGSLLFRGTVEPDRMTIADLRISRGRETIVDAEIQAVAEAEILREWRERRDSFAELEAPRARLERCYLSSPLDEKRHDFAADFARDAEREFREEG